MLACIRPWNRLFHSKSTLGSPDCRMIDINVPTRSSLWSGTGTVVVSPFSVFCITMWLPLRRASVNPYVASIVQTSPPDSTRSLANCHLNVRHIHFIMKAALNLGG